MGWADPDLMKSQFLQRPFEMLRGRPFFHLADGRGNGVAIPSTAFRTVSNRVLTAKHCKGEKSQFLHRPFELLLLLNETARQMVRKSSVAIPSSAFRTASHWGRKEYCKLCEKSQFLHRPFELLQGHHARGHSSSVEVAIPSSGISNCIKVTRLYCNNYDVKSQFPHRPFKLLQYNFDYEHQHYIIEKLQFLHGLSNCFVVVRAVALLRHRVAIPSLAFRTASPIAVPAKLGKFKKSQFLHRPFELLQISFGGMMFITYYSSQFLHRPFELLPLENLILFVALVVESQFLHRPFELLPSTDCARIERAASWSQFLHRPFELLPKKDLVYVSIDKKSQFLHRPFELLHFDNCITELTQGKRSRNSFIGLSNCFSASAAQPIVNFTASQFLHRPFELLLIPS